MQLIATHKRIKWLDFAKGFTIFFVVLMHVISSAQKTLQVNNLTLSILHFVIFTFVMPCFFAISGYLYKSTNTWYKYKIMLYKKIISLGVPYIIFSIIYVTMQHFGETLGSNKGTIHYIYSWSSLLKILVTPISYMWFLYALLIIFIISGLMDLFHFNEFAKLIISLLFLILTFLFPLWTNYSDAFANMSCFQIGYFIKLLYKYKSFIITKYVHKINFLLIAFIWIISLVFQFINTGLNYPTENMTYIDCIPKLISIFVLFIIFINFHHNWIFNYFNKYGKLTLVIYLVHVPIDSIVRQILLRCGVTNKFIIICLLVIVVWYLSLFVCYLCSKLNLINFIFYPRRYINKLIYNINNY